MSIIVALCLPVIIGGAAYGIEVGYWRYDQGRVQQAADAAAYAGAVAKRSGGSTMSGAAVTSAATAAAQSNSFNTATDTITVNIPSTATPSDPNSVEAVITRSEPPIFTAYIRCLVAQWQNNSSCPNNSVTVTASSTASFSTAGDACILALSPSASKAVDVAGNASVTLNGCTVMSNSMSSSALNVQGSGAVNAPCMYASGGAYLGGSVNLTTCGAVKTGVPPVADPFGSLAMPSYSGNCKNQANGATLQPDHYCSMTLKNSVTLKPGVYVIDGGSLTINANANVTGTGVTFYLVNGASVSMNGNSDVQLAAPTSGAYAGFLFINDRANTGTITINGDSASTVTGTIYSPNAAVNYSGNFSGTSGCTQIVAQSVYWSGSTTFADNCSAFGMTPVSVGSVVRLSA